MPNPISTALAKMKTAFAKQDNSTVVGIDIGSSAIKIVQLKKERGKVVLETYGAVALGPYGQKKVGEIVELDDESLISALNDVIKEANVTTKMAALSIQSASSLVFILDLPKISEQQLSSVVPNEARKYIPVPLSEVALDWWVIPTQTPTEDKVDQSSGSMKVLVAAIRNDTIDRYKRLVSQANVTADFFEIEIFSIIRSTFRHELQPVVVIDIGASGTRIAIVEYGVVKKFHTVSTGSYALSTGIGQQLQVPFLHAEKIKKTIGLKPVEQQTDERTRQAVQNVARQLLSEITTVLLSYEKEQHKAIGKMILTGGGARLQGFREELIENFSADVLYGDPFGKAETPEFLQEILRSVGPEFSVAFGLALKKLQ